MFIAYDFCLSWDVGKRSHCLKILQSFVVLYVHVDHFSGVSKLAQRLPVDIARAVLC